MATEYILSFRDNRPLGTFAEIESLLRGTFPNVQFVWRTSGVEKLRLAEERGIEFPPLLREGLESLPSLYEAIIHADGCYVEICLGAAEPVIELIVEPKGYHPDLERWMLELESKLGTELRMHGTPPID